MLCVVNFTYSSQNVTVYGSIPQALSWAELQDVMLSLEGLQAVIVETMKASRKTATQ